MPLLTTKENKSKIGQESSSIHEAVIARKCVCTKALPQSDIRPASRMNQAMSEEKENERNRDRKDRGRETDGR